MKGIGILGIILVFIFGLIWFFFGSIVAEILTWIGMGFSCISALAPEKKSIYLKRIKTYEAH